MSPRETLEDITAQVYASDVVSIVSRRTEPIDVCRFHRETAEAIVSELLSHPDDLLAALVDTGWKATDKQLRLLGGELLAITAPPREAHWLFPDTSSEEKLDQ